MEFKFFKIWYSGLKMLGVISEMTEESAKICLKMETCTSCEIRGRCPIRPFFYLNEHDFEMQLQISEYVIVKAFSKIFDESEYDTEQGTGHIRLKRETERKLHEVYSYER